MRIGVVVVTTLIGLATLACTSVGETVPTNANTVCVETLRFVDDDQRSAFLDRNADRIIRETATDALFIMPDTDAPSLEIASSEIGSCPGEGLAAAHGLDGRFFAANRQVSALEVQSRLEQILSLNLSGTESDVYRCVVRTDSGGLDVFGLMSRRLWFSGLRRAHLEGADGVIYVAAQESCGLLMRFASAAMHNLELADPRLVSCGETTFRGCGYPKDTTFGR